MKLLFVCMGNICRSPSAENVMRELLVREGLADRFELDSAGTIDYHTGKEPDPRMTQAATARGIVMKGRARQVRKSDFEDFDLVLAMDRENESDLKRMAANADQRSKIKMFCEFCTQHGHDEVPDPYYGGEAGFELVLDLLEDGCAGILRQWRAGELTC